MRLIYANTADAGVILSNLQVSGLKPCDGFYIPGCPGSAIEDLIATSKVIALLRYRGFVVIPGVLALYGQPLSTDSWVSSATWKEAAKWVDYFCPQGGAGEFCIDAEPPTGLYLSRDRRQDLLNAMYPVITLAQTRKLKIHILPGWPYAITDVLMWALGPSHVVICDESTYKWAGIDGSVHAGQTAASILGCGYRPGLYWQQSIDPTVIAALTMPGMPANTWAWPTSAECLTIGKKA
jgi:hypothetical protein